VKVISDRFWDLDLAHPQLCKLDILKDIVKNEYLITSTAHST